MTDAEPFIPHTEIGVDIHCVKCGYNLRGCVSERCPECGYLLEGIRSSESRIPWVQRREIGWLRGYWRTVWMVTRSNRKFCEEYVRPVSYRDARAFQFVTVLHAYFAILLATVLFYFLGSINLLQGLPILGPPFVNAGRTEPTLLSAAIEELWPVALLHVCLILFLFAATGVGSYFFHPRNVTIERQNSGVAMSYYACGTLSYSVVLAITACGAWVHHNHACWWRDLYLLVTFFGAILLVVAWWDNLVRIARRTMPQLRWRAWAVGVIVPALWIVLAGLLLFGLPVAVIGVLLVFVSLG